MSNRDRLLRRKSKKYQLRLNALVERAKKAFVELKQQNPDPEILKEKAVSIYKDFDHDWQVEVRKALMNDNLRIDPAAFQQAISVVLKQLEK